jgi:hypothetical protein
MSLNSQNLLIFIFTLELIVVQFRRLLGSQGMGLINKSKHLITTKASYQRILLKLDGICKFEVETSSVAIGERCVRVQGCAGRAVLPSGTGLREPARRGAGGERKAATGCRARECNCNLATAATKSERGACTCYSVCCCYCCLSLFLLTLLAANRLSDIRRVHFHATACE